MKGDRVKLTKTNLSMALQRYLRGELPGSEIESWENQIEGREDIQFEADSMREVGDVLHELANPTLTQPLDRARAKTLLDALLVP